LEESGLFRPTLSDLHELNLHQRQSASWWTALVNFVGNLVMLVLFIGLVTFISVRLYRYRKSQKLSAIPQEE
jgi:heme/copper-type cytochrome/quinol oxidase subunit 2